MSSRPAIALALSCTLLLSGCLRLGKDYVRPDLPLPSAWRSTAAASPAFSDGAANLPQWWQQLGDPTLEQLVDTALRASPDMRTALARLDESRARRDFAAGARFPTLRGGPQVSRSRSAAAFVNTGSTTLYQLGFDAAWEPDLFGRIGRGIEAAEADLEARQADLDGVRVSLAAEVALNWIEWQRARQRLQIARNNLQTQRDTLQIAEWRAMAGLGTQLEVDQARANAEQTRASLPRLETDLAAAANRLAVLTGQAPGSVDDLLVTSAAPVRPADTVAVGIPADTLRQRPDVRAAERRLAAETARTGQRTADLYPTLNLTGTFGWRSLDVGGLGDPANVFRSLTGSLLQTLFDGGRIRANIRIQNALQENALAQYEKSVLTALEEVENALVSYASNRERIEALQAAVTAARSAAELAAQRYQSGVTDFQRLLDAERTRLSAEDALASAEAEGLSALVTLYKALGGGWQDTAVIN